MPITVTLTTSGGFEMSAVQGSGATETQAGSFTAGSTLDTVSTDATTGVQYILQTTTANSFTFTWTPPLTNVGNVTMNLAGISGTSLNAATYTLTPALPPPDNLTLSPTSLTFSSSGGAVPPSQNFQVTSSGPPLSFTTSVSTQNGGNWLTATPAGAMTSQSVTVSVNPAGLAANTTFTGTVTIAASGANNSPQSVGVTLNMGAAAAPPTLTLSPKALTFNSVNGGTVNSQNVQVTSSSSSPLTFSTNVATTSGGNWLSITSSSLTTPASITVMVNPTGLSVGSTFMGSVTFTATGASNSPQTLPVSLVVSAPQPPPTTPVPLTFKFLVLDNESGGTSGLLADGTGRVDSTGALSGSGSFIIYSSGSGAMPATSSTGTWKATSLTSFTPATSGDDGSESGGTLTIKVQLSPMGAATPMTGTMKIAATGTDTGVTLSIDGGATYVPAGVGAVSIHPTTTSTTTDDRIGRFTIDH